MPHGGIGFVTLNGSLRMSTSLLLLRQRQQLQFCMLTLLLPVPFFRCGSAAEVLHSSGKQ